jgi:hypothetical protein
MPRLKYSLTNVTLSVVQELSDQLRAAGYDVRIHESGAVYPQTAGLPTPKATVTLVDQFPADPTLLSGPTSDRGSANAIRVPAFSVEVSSVGQKVALRGLGHQDYWRQGRFRVDGFAADAFQQREIHAALSDWLLEADVSIPARDYEGTPGNPQALGPLMIPDEGVVVQAREIPNEHDAVRYYIQATAIVRYVE